MKLIKQECPECGNNSYYTSEEIRTKFTQSESELIEIENKERKEWKNKRVKTFFGLGKEKKAIRPEVADWWMPEKLGVLKCPICKAEFWLVRRTIYPYY